MLMNSTAASAIHNSHQLSILQYLLLPVSGVKLTTLLKSNLQQIPIGLTKCRLGVHDPMHKRVHGEYHEPQTFETAAQNQQQHQIPPEVPPHHEEPVHGNERGRQAQAGAGGSHDLSRALLARGVDCRCIDGVVIVETTHCESVVV